MRGKSLQESSEFFRSGFAPQCQSRLSLKFKFIFDKHLRVKDIRDVGVVGIVFGTHCPISCARAGHNGLFRFGSISNFANICCRLRPSSWSATAIATKFPAQSSGPASARDWKLPPGEWPT
jgi:hypothetical protein